LLSKRDWLPVALLKISKNFEVARSRFVRPTRAIHYCKTIHKYENNNILKYVVLISNLKLDSGFGGRPDLFSVRRIEIQEAASGFRQEESQADFRLPETLDSETDGSAEEEEEEAAAAWTPAAEIEAAKAAQSSAEENQAQEAENQILRETVSPSLNRSHPFTVRIQDPATSTPTPFFLSSTQFNDQTDNNGFHGDNNDDDEEADHTPSSTSRLLRRPESRTREAGVLRRDPPHRVHLLPAFLCPIRTSGRAPHLLLSSAHADEVRNGAVARVDRHHLRGAVHRARARATGASGVNNAQNVAPDSGRFLRGPDSGIARLPAPVGLQLQRNDFVQCAEAQEAERIHGRLHRHLQISQG
jgi:hypothetical protein